MSKTTDETSNGKPAKQLSVIGQAHERWVKAGSKRPSPKELEAIKKALRDAETAIQAALEAVETARDKRHAVAVAAIESVGAKVSLDLGKGFGPMVPSGQGNRVFYRRKGEFESL